MWVITGIMFAPVFALASHAGYILIAWVTEPAKSTSAFLTGLGCFLYMFFMFRQCYIVNTAGGGAHVQQGGGVAAGGVAAGGVAPVGVAVAPGGVAPGKSEI